MEDSFVEMESSIISMVWLLTVLYSPVGVGLQLRDLLEQITTVVRKVLSSSPIAPIFEPNCNNSCPIYLPFELL